MIMERTRKITLTFAVTIITFIAMAVLCAVNIHAEELQLNISGNGTVQMWHEEVGVVGSRYTEHTSSATITFTESELYLIIIPADDYLIGEVSYINSTSQNVHIVKQNDNAGVKYLIPKPLENLGTISVEFLPVHTVTAADPDDDHGTIVVTDGEEVMAGDEVSYTVSADEGYRIEYVYADGMDIGYSFTDENEYNGSLTVSDNHIITATYVKETYDVNFEISSNSTEGKFYIINENGIELAVLDHTNETEALTLTYGDTVTLKAEVNDPDGLYIFQGITAIGEGTLSGTDDPFVYTFTVGDIGVEGDDTASISASFIKEYVDIKFDIGKNGSITYTSPQGTVTVNSDNNTSYRSSADPFTFTAKPDTTLYTIGTVTFTDELGATHTIDGTNGTYSIDKALGDGTLSVTFTDALSYNVTVKSPGKENCEFEVKADGVKLPNGTHRVSANAKITISASTVDGSGYEFSYISKNDSILSDDSVYIIATPLTEDITLSAVFDEIETYKITVDYDEKMGEITQEGGLSKDGKTVQVNKGDKVTFTIDPASGYKINSVNYTGSNISKKGDEYTTSKVTADAKLTVKFVNLTEGVTSIDVDNNGDTVVSLKGVENVIEVADMYLGDILRAPMSKSGVLPTDVLAEIKNRNITLILDGKDYYWEIYGKNIINSATNANLTVTTGNDIIDEKFLGGIKNFADTVQFNVAYDGKLPFKGHLSVDVGDQHAGRYANLFYFNDSNFTLSRIDCVTVDKYGYATYAFSHASDYVIVIADKKLTASDLASSDNVTFEAIPLSSSGAGTLKTAGILVGGVLLVGIVIAIVMTIAGRRHDKDEEYEIEE